MIKNDVECTWAEGYGYVHASALGLQPGKWPTTLMLPGPAGRKIPCLFMEHSYVNGELTSTSYACGTTFIIVFND